MIITQQRAGGGVSDVGRLPLVCKLGLQRWFLAVLLVRAGDGHVGNSALDAGLVIQDRAGSNDAAAAAAGDAAGGAGAAAATLAAAPAARTDAWSVQTVGFATILFGFVFQIITGSNFGVLVYLIDGDLGTDIIYIYICCRFPVNSLLMP